jgi:hypothetical protein
MGQDTDRDTCRSLGAAAGGLSIYLYLSTNIYLYYEYIKYGSVVHHPPNSSPLLRACTSGPTLQLCPRVPFRRSAPKTDVPPPTHRDAASQCRRFAAPPRRLQVDVARPSTPTLRSTRRLPFTQPSPPPLICRTSLVLSLFSRSGRTTSICSERRLPRRA